MKRLYDKALVDQIAKNYGNETAFLSEFSKALLDIIREGLIRDGQVRLHQFGTFKLKWMKSRNGVNPSTGEKMVIQGRPRVIFTPAKFLKENIEPNPPALIPVEIASAEQVPTTQPVVPVAVIEDVVTTEIRPEKTPEIILEEKSAPVEQKVEELSTENKLMDEQPEVSSTDKDAAAVSEEVVANIQDEIEVLEQVVEILRTDVKEEDNIEDSYKKEASSEWLDTPVVEQIKEISELQYFKQPAATAVASDQEPVESAERESNNDVEKIAAKKLDFDLTENNEQTATEETESHRNWFAIAATVVVLLATGILFNALWTDSTPVQEKAPQLYSHYPEENIEPVDSELAQKPVVSDEQLESEVVANDIETVDVSGDKAELTVDENVSEPVKTEQHEDKLADVSAEENQIIVSTEQYNEVKRASAEQSVYFLQTEHRLSNGDSLWRLAKKHYVNPFYWPHIYQANHKKIENPDKVKMGRVITLPTLYGTPDELTKKDKRNIAMGYYFNYLYHKQKGNPYAYFSLIGVDKYDAGLLIEFQEEISRSDVSNLALLY